MLKLIRDWNLSIVRNIYISLAAIVTILLLGLVVFKSNVSAIENYSLSLSVDKTNLSANISALPEPKVHILQQNLTLSTNNPNGAQLIISSREHMPMNIAPVSESLGQAPLSLTNGTAAAPAKLNANSLGFAIPNELGYSSIASKFSSTASYQSTDNATKEAALFARVPNISEPVQLYSGPSMVIPVFYGVSIDSMLREGVYQMEVLYTVFSNIPEIINSSDDTYLEVDPKIIKNVNGGDVITISTNLKSNTEIPASRITAYVGNKSCESMNIIENVNQGSGLKLSCISPSHSVGRYSIAIRVEGLSLVMITKMDALEYKKDPENISEISTMQEMNSTICNNMTEHQTKTLRDTRDNETYNIAKLKDGKCWMTQNLRLKLSTTETLDPLNTDISGSWTPSRSTELSLSGLWFGILEPKKAVFSYYDQAKPEYGIYYTHAAATAETAAEITTGGQDAPGSICPRGWRLPKTTTAYDSQGNDFYMLAAKYKGNASWTGASFYGNGNEMRYGAPKISHAGFRHDHGASINNLGSSGYLRSSTIHDSTFSYTMSVDNRSIVPRGMVSHTVGYSVRCVAR